jgi:alanine dehydrogenase
VSVPFLARDTVYAALEPTASLEAVREAFVAHARGEWFMPSKVYVPAPPDGDFRAMPASGGGYAVLKWVTALRTGAAAVLAADTLAADSSSPAAVVGSGVNGRAVARTFLARGRPVLLWDAQPEQAEALAAELGQDVRVAASREQALGAAVVATVTPGSEILFSEGSLQRGQHASLMGADGRGKAEIAVEELLRARVVCDEWAQASHNGDSARAAEAGRLSRKDVAELGRVLVGEEEGRRSDEEITVFDSTGLAVQDLAVAVAVYERWRDNPHADAFAGTTKIELG